MAKIGTRNKKDNTDLAPDGGWGWIVCIGTFFANFIADGTMFSSGVQMMAFLKYFGETKAATAWVSSSQLGLSMMMGPVVSFLIVKYSVRTVAIAGGVIAFLGTVAGAFSPNLTILIFTYGVICGIGICFFFLSSIVAVGLYFTRKRAIATGIAMSGSGLGVIVYPYLTQLLLDMYDWRNTLLIIAALCLNAVVCGALFRPLTRRNIDSSTCKCLEENSVSDSDERRSMLSLRYKNEESVSTNKVYNSTSGIGGELKSFLDTNLNENFDKRQFFSEQHLSSIKTTNVRKTEYHFLLSPRLRSDVFYSGSINFLPSYDSKLKFENGLEDDNKKAKEKNDSLFLSCIQMFRQLRFTLLLCCMVMWTSQSITMTYIPDMVVSKGIPRYHAAMLISIIGVTNTVVRILAGFTVDFFHVRSIHLYLGALCLGAITNIALPWCDSFPLLATCAVGFGICMGTVVCLRTILIADILGIDQLTVAFGIIAFFQGLTFIVDPPLAGFIYDMTGSYIYPFLMTGCFYIIGVIMCAILLFIHHNGIAETTVEVVLEADDVCKQNGKV
ncbi:monocarboxylate transporter 12-like isoform X1 [Mytilus californianus]|uniref:monocarboxylate transporter 12-like isoform X1 n=1 Tax=Mytilus californianus TaxID=6549 RepID=UPI002247B38D|nr:monocarboxylate transporter 12-like isoform X1 [Mytilus californianus]XP_052061339.1 monocarboxylate transporter 12-like isoform X1 [Mytilus californianus]XP_052061340.1 monocarboxylate transporter 12-like isoform X1 [Mytilus californianus]XP_052061341.1 monocarboxylate transporter 12-like isoform X1 [Mytilus californianus]XP_052061342.1 monocarboxylate transporter 12-like isoform X1 [Mytilus californianus]XP_052061343.1 monocarboxylate transporter 12-like isoform X1 [Mytilus californianus]